MAVGMTAAVNAAVLNASDSARTRIVFLNMWFFPIKSRPGRRPFDYQQPIPGRLFTAVPLILSLWRKYAKFSFDVFGKQQSKHGVI
jgi:hypothetical protein